MKIMRKKINEIEIRNAFSRWFVQPWDEIEFDQRANSDFSQRGDDGSRSTTRYSSGLTDEIQFTYSWRFICTSRRYNRIFPSEN